MTSPRNDVGSVPFTRAMSLFRYGRDFYTDAAAQQLLSAGAWLLVALVGIFIAVHLLRRSTGHPVSNTPAAKLPPHARVVRYEIGARLYHWGNHAPRDRAGREWRGPLLARLARPRPVAPDARSHRGPLRALPRPAHCRGAPARRWSVDVVRRARCARPAAHRRQLPGPHADYPAFGKYDPWQKVYHAFLTLLAAGLIFSGAYLLLSAEAWATFSHAWMRVMRLLHDVAAFAFIAILIGHVYFGIIRVNWPQLVSMCHRTASRLELQPLSRRRAAGSRGTD